MVRDDLIVDKHTGLVTVQVILGLRSYFFERIGISALAFCSHRQLPIIPHVLNKSIYFDNVRLSLNLYNLTFSVSEATGSRARTIDQMLDDLFSGRMRRKLW